MIAEKDITLLAKHRNRSACFPSCLAVLYEKIETFITCANQRQLSHLNKIIDTSHLPLFSSGLVYIHYRTVVTSHMFDMRLTHARLMMDYKFICVIASIYKWEYIVNIINSDLLLRRISQLLPIFPRIRISYVNIFVKTAYFRYHMRFTDLHIFCIIQFRNLI